MLANEKSKGMGDQEEGMDLADEVDMGGKVQTQCVDLQWRFELACAFTSVWHWLVAFDDAFLASNLADNRCIDQCTSNPFLLVPWACR